MTITVGSLWKSRETGEGHVVKSLGTTTGIMNTEFDIVQTLSESGRYYTHTKNSLVKYYDEVDDV
jgi:hypothetical protein